jgi:hypothetical protein
MYLLAAYRLDFFQTREVRESTLSIIVKSSTAMIATGHGYDRKHPYYRDR